VEHFVTVCLTAAGAFVGTNIDNFVVLLLLILGIPEGGHRRWQVFAGQYLGFAVLVVASLLAALALGSVPLYWAGLLGLIPLALGVRGLLQVQRGRPAGREQPIHAGSLLTVAAVTIASGGDNISVYVLLFREEGAADVAWSIVVFVLMLGAMCTAALLIGERAKALLPAIRGAQWVTSAVFTAIGSVLLIRTGALLHVAELAA
jgi:cadmium resistance protein CadD (predicted permease)